jgi:hypothetical protein
MLKESLLKGILNQKIEELTQKVSEIEQFKEIAKDQELFTNTLQSIWDEIAILNVAIERENHGNCT